jgi:hypothetical protein
MLLQRNRRQSVYFCARTAGRTCGGAAYRPEGEIANPVVIEDMVYYCPRGGYELTAARSYFVVVHAAQSGHTGAPPFFAAMAEDLFCQKGESCFLAPIAAPDLAQPALTKQEPPSAALRDWVSGRIWRTRSRRAAC